MTTAAKILLTFCLFLIALHIWGTVSPSHDNWGVHFFSFFDTSTGVIALGLMILLSIPPIQSKALERFEALLRLLSKLPVIVNYGIAAGIVYAGIRLFSAKLHLLGDGAILLRSVTLGIAGAEITSSFNNQPLMFWIYRTAMTLHPLDASPDPYTVYYSIDIFSAAVFLGFIFFTMRRLQRPLVENVLLGCLFFFGAGSQFFFGYVENYVLQYITAIAYAVTGWFALERRCPLAVPIVLFLLMVSLHLGATVFGPSLILLIIVYFKGKNRIRAIVFLSGLGVLGLAAVLMMGLNLLAFIQNFFIDSVNFLKPFSVPGGNFHYPMFSFNHLVDWSNSQLLIAPFGLITTIVLIFALPRETRWKEPALLFLLSAAACGMFFTWVVNSALGLARDWDLFAGFFTPLLVLPVYFFTNPNVVIQPRRYVLTVMVLVMMLHWGSWIGVNASADKHLARMEMLNSPKYLGVTTRLVYNEALANLFFDTQRYREARTHYLEFMAIDSSNTRIIGNIADVYRKLGEKENYFTMLQRAATLNSKDPGVYSNLGVEYAGRGDTAKAIELNEKAILLNPTMQKAHANLGILYSSKKQYDLAENHFVTAINLGMRDPVLFRYAGDISVFNNKYDQALQFYDAYLRSNPTDIRVKDVREKLVRSIQAAKKK